MNCKMCKREMTLEEDRGGDCVDCMRECEPRPICDGCDAEIDPDCCGCGDSREGHNSMWSGHSFVPMGCDCMRERG